MLTNIIPAAYRKLVYGIFGAIGLVLGALQVAYLAGHMGEPVWLIMALAAYGFAAAGTHATANANTPAPKNEAGEIGLPTLVPLMVLATLVLVVLLFIGVPR